MFDTLTVLGGGGWFPAQQRHTACALLRAGSTVIMLDGGTGVGRLAERPELLEGVEQVEILLTHFHLDHIVGLAYLAAIGLSERARVWGPGQQLYGTPTERMLDHFSHEPYHPVSLREQNIEVRDLPAGELELAGIRVAMRHQLLHSAPTIGYRFEDELAWITDTAYDPDSGPFARGCSLVAHETWCTTARPRNPDVHSSARQAAEVALQAQAEGLLLIHLPPFEASVQPLLDEALVTMPHAQLGVDNVELSLQAV